MSQDPDRKKPTAASVRKLILNEYTVEEFDSVLAGKKEFQTLLNQYGTGSNLQTKLSVLLLKADTDEIIEQLQELDEQKYKKAITKHPLKYEAQRDTTNEADAIVVPLSQSSAALETVVPAPISVGSTRSVESGNDFSQLGVQAAQLTARPSHQRPRRSPALLVGAAATILGIIGWGLALWWQHQFSSAMDRIQSATKIVECNVALAGFSAAQFFSRTSGTAEGSMKLPEHCKPGALAHALEVFDNAIFQRGGSIYLQDVAISAEGGMETLLKKENKELLKQLESNCYDRTRQTDWQSCAILISLAESKSPNQLFSLLSHTSDLVSLSKALCSKGIENNHSELCIHLYYNNCRGKNPSDGSCIDLSPKMDHLCENSVTAACFILGLGKVGELNKSTIENNDLIKACNLALPVRKGCPYNMVLPLSPCDDSGRLACLELAQRSIGVRAEIATDRQCRDALQALERAEALGGVLSPNDRSLSDVIRDRCSGK